MSNENTSYKGTILKGRYIIDIQLGEGNEGCVFLVKDTKDNIEPYL